ncbi:MAG: hypothetical protein AB3N23_00760 [Paracoccaceae bacterium]
MDELPIVTDEESLRAWLETQPQEVSVAIAIRAATRVFPLWWSWSQTMGPGTAGLELKTLWGSLVTLVATASPALAKKAIAFVLSSGRTEFLIAAAAYDADESITVVGDSFALAAAESVNAAAFAFDAARHVSVNTPTTSAVSAAAASNDAGATYARSLAGLVNVPLWDEIGADVLTLTNSESVWRRPLWSDGISPFDAEWTQIKSEVQFNPDWAFWLRWYQSLLDGKPLPLPLLTDIALIEPAVWDAGPSAVAQRIAEIELEHARRATPNAEDIRVNADGVYQLFPRSALPSKTLQDACDRIGDVVRSIRQAQHFNQYSALGPEADLLEDHLDRYHDNPLRLWEVCQKVIRHTSSKVTDGLLPDRDDLVMDTQTDLQNTADDIYNFDQDAKDTIDARARLQFERLVPEERSKIAPVVEAVAARSDPELALQLREDWRVVNDPGLPDAEKKDERYRLGSRLVKVAAIGGALSAGLVAALAQAEAAVSGARYIWEIVRPLLGM